MRHRLLVVFLALGVLVSPEPAPAAEIFERVGIAAFGTDGLFSGARLEALGGADVAGAHGAGAALLNLAPLPGGNEMEVGYDLADFDRGSDVENLAVKTSWDGLRVDLVRSRYDRLVVVRTAFEPQTRRVDYVSTLDVAGLSYDVSRLLAPRSAWDWTVGAAYRRYHADIDGSSTASDTFDLGTSVRVAASGPYVHAALMGTVAWQNVFDDQASSGGRLVNVPRPLRAGVTADATYQVDGREWFGFRMAYAHTHDLSGLREGTHHMGVEFEGARLLAVRAGYDSGFAGGTPSLGLGFALDQPGSPLRVAFDWTRWIDRGEGDLYGARVGAAF